jgi:hypothetical protein
MRAKVLAAQLKPAIVAVGERIYRPEDLRPHRCDVGGSRALVLVVQEIRCRDTQDTLLSRYIYCRSAINLMRREDPE